MNCSRRQFLKQSGLVFAGATLARPAYALDYPTRPIRIVVGFPAGSPSDIGARMMGQWLSTRLGQPVVIENQPGAGSNLATETVVRAAPDGYTLLWVVSANAINATLYKNLKFNFLKDITPVAGVARYPLIMEVNASSPVKTVPEFIAFAKANPGKVNMASAGNGSSQHLAGELFKSTTGIDVVHVPYRGSPQAITDLIGGQVQFMFDVWPSSIAHIKSGTLRALAVTTTTRASALPDVPALSEFLSGYELSALQGIGAPKNTPVEIIDKINAAANAALADPAFRARLVELGGQPMEGTPIEFSELMSRETAKVGALVKQAGATVD